MSSNMNPVDRSSQRVCAALPSLALRVLCLAVSAILFSGVAARADDAEGAAASPAAVAPAAVAPERRIGDLPEAVASFGAAAIGDAIYVYSGHIGRAHAHSRDNLSRGFRRSRASELSTWEELPADEPLQGLGFVAVDGRLLRIGGLSARNAAGEPEDLVSVASCRVYDPAARRWETAPSLPSPRSSHDAALCGRRVFVVGGWSIDGKTRSFHEDMLVLDVDETPWRWRSLPGPAGSRRALAVAAWGDLVLALGGLSADGEMLRRVDIYDPKTSAWTQGPELPFDGFGVAAIDGARGVVASGRDGRVAILPHGAGEWTAAGELVVGRFFHRFVAANGGILAIGGAGKGGHLRSIEPLSLAADRGEAAPTAGGDDEGP